ncbi:unnamed protein product [Parnassius apollo]|uniref:(apollo) hypothetical protein n=1 Tax=Parnassius apollo TaxID=110799 RepID=A0A8S3WFZ3_PARAO|nr:unnamed protein product [Parnassius apollo]
MLWLTHTMKDITINTIGRPVAPFWIFYQAVTHIIEVHFFYVVATKLFVLKIVYGVIFYVILTKAWHFVIWFIHYLKEKKSHENYVEFDHYDHHDHHGYYDHQPYSGYEYINPTYGLGDNYSKFKKHGVYDADGSYSVKKT